jgi:transposase
VDRGFLEECLAKGMSLDAIGKAAGKHPSTVSYWLKKYGLIAVGRSQHAPKGEIDTTRLEALVDEGTSIRKIAEELNAGYSTIRYWLGKLELETRRAARRKESEAARKAGLRKTKLKCPTHGHTVFFARPEGGFRCTKCNSEAVAERRRQVKRQLVDEAGGRCRLCGFSEHPAALHFHHLDPSTKEFHLGLGGQCRSIAKMRAEARKCVLLCANCHALVEADVKKVTAPLSLELERN